LRERGAEGRQGPFDLILAAGTGKAGPGPLVSMFATGSHAIPVTIVPEPSPTRRLTPLLRTAAGDKSPWQENHCRDRGLVGGGGALHGALHPLAGRHGGAHLVQQADAHPRSGQFIAILIIIAVAYFNGNLNF